MRWFTSKQVAALLGVAALVAVSAGFGLGWMAFSGSAGGAAVAADARVSSGLSGTADGGNGDTTFEYLQSPDPVPEQDGSSRSVAGGNGRTFTDDELNNIRLYELYQHAVVNISTEVLSYSFFDAVPQEGATGSGAIIDTRGYILTNNHVVKNATKLYVGLADGERLEAQLVGVDAENDLAVIKIDPGTLQLTTITLGSSADLKVGQKVLAIGNPFSFDRTLTTGIISGLGRPIRGESNVVINGMIQTDASINPGNSGGPLLDSEGKLIGINTMIYSPSQGSVGVGFAVPVDTAKRVVPELIANGRVRRGWIDGNPVQLFPQLVSYARLPVRQGLLLSQIDQGGNLEQAGLRGGQRNQAVRYGRSVIYLGGDVLVELDGKPLDSVSALYEALEDNRPGDVVRAVYYRGQTRLEARITLSERPARFTLE